MRITDENACPNSITASSAVPEVVSQVLYNNPFMGFQPPAATANTIPAATDSVGSPWCTPSDVQFVASLSASQTAASSVTSKKVSEKKTGKKFPFLFRPVSGSTWRRPKCLTFTMMIAMAMTSRADKSLPVPAIYEYITKSFPFFRTSSTKWRNSVRHNLSQTTVFCKIGIPRTEQKGYNWTFNEDKREWLEQEVQNKRISDLRILSHQIGSPSVLMDMQAIGLLHPSLTL